MSKQPRSRAKTGAKTSGKNGAGAKKMRIKTVKKTEIVVSGPVPTAIVTTSKGLVKKIRQGRGFSIPELRSAGLDAGRGRKLGLRVDPRRGSERRENVEALKKWVTVPAEAPKKAKPKPTAKKTGAASKARGKK